MRATRCVVFVLAALAVPEINHGGPAQVEPVRASRAPVVRVRLYTLNARVRPLLFWLRKNGVGEGRITWRSDGHDAHGYELLVGSDPFEAPRKINKWGYLAEDLSSAGAAIVGVMKQAKADSMEDAERQVAHEGEGGYVFETITATVSGNTSITGTAQVRTPADLTFRDLEALLALAARAAPPRRTASVPENTAPGFLSAVAEVLRESLTASADGSSRHLRPPPPRAYIYNGRLYDLRLRSLKSIANFEVAGRRFGSALDGAFTITNLSTRHVTKFSIVYGTTRELAGVPLKIVFRPKWWFEAELVLAR